MRIKGISDILVRLVMILHEGAKTRSRMNLELSDESKVKVCCYAYFLDWW